MYSTTIRKSSLFFSLQTLLFLTSVSYVNSKTDNQTSPVKKLYSDWKFKDYIKKFRPKTVWDKIDMRCKIYGENLTKNEQFDVMMKGIDETDELLRLDVASISTHVAFNDTRRQYKPVVGVSLHKYDPFELRFRIYELIKHAIYQARNKMVIMQKFRAKYRSKSLYKMGYLFSKTDTVCKTFSKFAFRAFKACTSTRHEELHNHYMIHIMQAEERLLDLWFDAELLADLIVLNDKNMKEMLETVNVNRTEAWEFVD